MTRLPSSDGFERFTLLELDKHGRLLHPTTRAVVPDGQVHEVLRRALVVPPDVTDIFVWVHGWQNDLDSATRTTARLAAGIEATYAAQPAAYPNLRAFRGQYVGVHWPSKSSPLPGGYRRIRDRAHEMTCNGYAEYVLASLLGYLDDERRPPPTGPATLRTAGGQYLHCVGHSFGGRFLCEAVRAAAKPSPPTLALLPPNTAFDFTVDTLLVFQTAAPPEIFTGPLAPLLTDAPLQGQITLTFSQHDRANCRWHRITESGRRGIGCGGASEPADRIRWTALRPADEPYQTNDLDRRIVNVDAGWLYREAGCGRKARTRPTGTPSRSTCCSRWPTSRGPSPNGVLRPSVFTAVRLSPTPLRAVVCFEEWIKVGRW